MKAAEQKTIRVAPTATLHQGMAVMDAMRQNGLSRIWTDKADVGKTVTAREYQRRYPDVVAYVDGSQCKTLSQFIRAIAIAFGLDADGGLKDVFTRTVQHIKTLNKPMLIVDEAGDLTYNAFLEQKAYWNAVNNDRYYQCSFMMIGAQCLEEKIKKLRARDKVGYEELMRRYGGTFVKFWPKDEGARLIMFHAHAKAIVEVNAPNVAMELILAPTDYEKEQNIKQVKSLTRVMDNILKLRK